MSQVLLGRGGRQGMQSAVTECNARKALGHAPQRAAKGADLDPTKAKARKQEHGRTEKGKARKQRFESKRAEKMKWDVEFREKRVQQVRESQAKLKATWQSDPIARAHRAECQKKAAGHRKTAMGNGFTPLPSDVAAGQ